MNTIDATPQLHWATVPHWSCTATHRLTRLIRTNAKGQENFRNVIYGKQSLTEAGPGLDAASASPIDAQAA